MKNLIIVSALILLSSCNMLDGHSEEIALVVDGVSDYVIVASVEGTAQQKLAVKEFKKFFAQSTGVNLNVISPSESGKYPHKIFIGKSQPMETLLGNAVIDSLKSQESLVATKDGNLILIGDGEFGTNYAVYSFLENELGIRWYTAVGDIKIPKHRNLEILTVNRHELPTFTYRYASEWWHQIKPAKYYFFFRNRGNKGINSSEFRSKTPPPVGIKNITPDIGPGCHSLGFYMNPGDKYHPAYKPYPKPRLKNLFQTHPDFFSMNQSGKRVKTMQVCFSNMEMRKLLTRQIFDVIEASGGKGVVSLDANDVPGRFCHCPKCAKLEKKYNCLAGPLLDYLIELSGKLEKQYPEVLLKTLAYRKKQSEIPPENIDELPDNLVIVFAPIDDNFATTLKHPSNIDTFNNLKRWCEISKNVWVWYYTNPYLPEHPPFGNVERMAKDMKYIREAGANGTQVEHGSGVREDFNFGELQTWLLLRLFQDPNQDLEPLVKEFTDYYYGAAAELMRRYIHELENARKGMKLKLPWNPSISMFRYLTPANIARWEKMFDKMEQLAASDPQNLFHVQKVRVSLDLAAIGEYKKLVSQFPDFKPKLKGLAERFRSVYIKMVSKKMPKSKQVFIRKMEKMLKLKLLFASLKKAKPLPRFFNQFNPSDVKEAIPLRKIKNDPDAAYGIAQSKEISELPFTSGIYDNHKAKWMRPKSIQKKDIKPDQYAIYKIGETTITQNCLFWGSQKWIITVPLEKCYELGNPNQGWTIYASLKFEGPLYGSDDKSIPNRVSCDRIVLVRDPKR